jgi:hypothetical protein
MILLHTGIIFGLVLSMMYMMVSPVNRSRMLVLSAVVVTALILKSYLPTAEGFEISSHAVGTIPDVPFASRTCEQMVMGNAYGSINKFKSGDEASGATGTTGATGTGEDNRSWINDVNKTGSNSTGFFSFFGLNDVTGSNGSSSGSSTNGSSSGSSTNGSSSGSKSDSSRNFGTIEEELTASTLPQIDIISRNIDEKTAMNRTSRPLIVPGGVNASCVSKIL